MTEQTTLRRARGSQIGFTLTEVVVAVSITAFVMAGTISVFIFGLRSYHEESIKNQLNMNLEIATENLRRDIRLSSLCLGGNMAFYPAGAEEYQAISMPIAKDDDDDDLLERDSLGKILWDETVIYHVQTGTPDKLVRTVFSPKNSNATPSQVYQQLLKVVAGETTTAALPGETHSSRVIFENLVLLTIRPIPTLYDGYSPTVKMEEDFNFGSVMLSPGPHEVKLELAGDLGGKNNSSTGYKLGIDRFSATASDNWTEGEFYLSTNHYGVFNHAKSPGSSVAVEDMSGAGGVLWSGDEQLLFIPNSSWGATNPWLKLSIFNDCWIDSTFDTVGGVYEMNTKTTTNMVVSMKRGTAWDVASLSQPIGTNQTIDGGAGMFVTNVLYGMKFGPFSSRSDLILNGRWVRAKFNGPGLGSTNTCGIQSAKFMEYSNVGAGPSVALTFDGGNASVEIPAGTNKWSDWVNIELEKKYSYAVAFEVMNDSAKDSTIYWEGLQGSNSLSSMGGWGSNIYCVSEVEVRYPDEGWYRSGVFDTRCSAPAYKTLSWQHTEKDLNGKDRWVTGDTLAGDLDVRLRTADNRYMTNSTWQKASAMVEASYFAGGQYPAQDISAGSANPLPGDRFLQYEAMFTCEGTANNEYSADLDSVLIQWVGEEGPVDLNMDLGMGPDYGMYYATIDGQVLAKALEIDMTIYKDFGRAGRRQEVRGTMSVVPLNTGK